MICALFGCDPGNGARIAEDEGGPWIALCAVEVTGPARPQKHGEGEGRHQTRTKARRMAIARACTEADGGPTCQNLTVWSVEKEQCERLDAEAGRPAEHRCRVTVVRPAGPRKTTVEAEGPTKERACRRAKRQACEAVDGDGPCLHGAEGWTARQSTGRRRPTRKSRAP